MESWEREAHELFVVALLEEPFLFLEEIVAKENL